MVVRTTGCNRIGTLFPDALRFRSGSGIGDNGMGGKMLVGGCAAAAAAAVTASVWLGLLVAVAVSTALGLLHGLACITCRGNQVVSGVAVNVLAAGLTIVLGIAWFDQGGHTPQIGRASCRERVCQYV